jgi:hypothetical protein
VTTAEAVRAATARGLRFGIEDGIVYVYGDGSVVDEMAPMLTPHKANIRAAIVEHAEAMTVSDCAVAAAKLLRLGTWPPTSPAECAYHCGAPGAPSVSV